jgi:regulator of cell morphogenesis and NO signaling
MPYNLATNVVQRLRELTDNYNLPPDASNSHMAVFTKLHDLDNDLTKHLYLENKIVLPRLLAIESELNRK